MKKAIISGEAEAVKTTEGGTRYMRLIVDYMNFRNEKWVEGWTIWLPQTGFDDVAEGDWFELEGIPSASAYMGKDKEGNDKMKSNLNLNEPTIIQHKKIGIRETVDSQDADDRRKYGNEAPF